MTHHTAGPLHVSNNGQTGDVLQRLRRVSLLLITISFIVYGVILIAVASDLASRTMEVRESTIARNEIGIYSFTMICSLIGFFGVYTKKLQWYRRYIVSQLTSTLFFFYLVFLSGFRLYNAANFMWTVACTVVFWKYLRAWVEETRQTQYLPQV